MRGTPTAFAMSACLQIAISAAPATAAEEGGAQLCHIANAGFYISDGETGILIDALMDQGLGDWGRPSPRLEKAMEEGATPFDDVAAVFASHHHYDHFNPGPILRHMKVNPKTRYFLTAESLAVLDAEYSGFSGRDRVETALPTADGDIGYTVGSIKITLYPLDHGGQEQFDTLGMRVELAGKSILVHLGRIPVEPRATEGRDVEREPVDYLIANFFPLLEEGAAGRAAAAFKYKQAIPAHFYPPGVERDWLAVHGGAEGARIKALGALENAILLTGEMDCIPLD